MFSVFRGLRPILLATAVACTGAESTAPIHTSAAFLTAPDTTKVALIDLGNGTYRGFHGGLYPNGSNAAPAAHTTAGLARAAKIRPLDASGIPRAGGKIVFLSIGMSNTSMEFCAVNGTTDCYPESLMGRVAADQSLNHTSLVLVNGAQGGKDAIAWVSSTGSAFNTVRDRLTSLGVTEKQVQVVWLFQADANPTTSLPDTRADAYILETRMGSILRALRARYPNLQQVFVGSRAYGGYATTPENPEPYAYEAGLATKWLVQAQIDQMQNGRVVDSRAGDLNYNSTAPWVAWGPYFWANGTNARSDGLVWLPNDFLPDGTHPSQLGRAKVSSMLISFFSTSRFTKCWFVAGGVC